jgi:uncharacterized protein (TIGR02453 family)
MSTGFPGFPKASFDFLRELSKNNNRAWFEENKPRYKEVVVAPTMDFITAMQEPLREISPNFRAIPKAHGGSMYRIYRDARFSKDKRPYKEHIGCHFRHEAGKDAHAPGFYLHLEDGNVFFGGGVWMPPNPILGKIRTIIDAFPKSWQQVLDDADLLAMTDGVQGDGLKRPPRGFSADHPYITDLKRKSFYATRHISEEEACDPAFFAEVCQTYEAISPLMRFLTRAVELPYGSK